MNEYYYYNILLMYIFGATATYRKVRTSFISRLHVFVFLFIFLVWQNCHHLFVSI